MSLQPQDEQKDLQNPNEYTILETCQFSSQNIISNPVTTLTFSSITNVVRDLSTNNDPSSNIEDPSGIEKDLLTLSDEEDKTDEIMNNADADFGDLSCDERIDWLIKELETIELKKIDQSIQDRTMSIETQPPTNIRRRYRSDGKRQIEKSRSKPMAIRLPNLKSCKLNSNQSFSIQLKLITSNKNPSKKVYIHLDKLEYHADDLSKCDDDFVRVPLTQTDIQNGIKQLARISIIKAKLDTYTFELIPFDPLSTDNSTEIYENENAKSIVAKAKCFRDIYNLKSSRIACQLLIKENDTWFPTDIVCETNIMEEKEKSDKSKKANKRPASSHVSDDDEDEYQNHCQSSAKKQKRSLSLIKVLPITRVKKT